MVWVALIALGLLGLAVSSGAIGWALGTRSERRRAYQEAERNARLFDVPFRGGEPHNYDGPPARVSAGRIRNRRNFNLQGFKYERK